MLRLWTAYQSRFIQDEEGASMVEYALLVALIAVVVIAAALFLGEQSRTKFSEVGATLEANEPTTHKRNWERGCPVGDPLSCLESQDRRQKMRSAAQDR